MQILLSLLVLVSLQMAPAFAVNPDEILDDPKLEQRARDLSGIIRCMKCQNQSIDDSDADLAKDLRLLVRDRITKGDSNDEVLGYLVDRYGEFVLLKPSFSMANLVLWVAPLIALVAGLFLSWRMIASRQTIATEEKSAGDEISLSQNEHDKLTKILDERD
ncbi:MAG: cytochrome c-type biogenesis protein [Salaquimonas sp.]